MALVLLTLAWSSAWAQSAKGPPNIVIILADDLGYGDLRSYNADSRIPTPHLDRLATEGMRFTDAHSPSALCTPTRYGLLTGRYAWRTRLKKGVLNGYSPLLIEPGRLTLASLLKQRGYATAAIGKWHLGLGAAEPADFPRPLDPGPNQVGFDYFFGIPASLDMPPYVLYLPLTAPHTPWMPAAEFRDRSGAGYYGDFVAHVDDVAGRVLRALDRAKVRDNTLVVFTSDNGAHWLPSDIEAWGHRANGALRGQKSDIWEGGHRIPFIVRWPGTIRAGGTSQELICLTDVLATVAGIVHAPLPRDAAEDSVTLLPVLLGRTLPAPIREAIVHHSGDGTFGIRQGTWKLALGLGSHGFSEPRTVAAAPGGPEGQLYDLATDPGEQHNVWLQHPEIVARLTALLSKYQAEGRSR